MHESGLWPALVGAGCRACDFQRQSQFSSLVTFAVLLAVGSDQHKIRNRRFIWAVLVALLFLPGPAYLAYHEYLRRSVLLWEYPCELEAGNLNIGNDGTVYVCTFEFGLIALHSDGSEKWRYNSGGDLKFRPVSDSSGNVFFTSMSYPSPGYPNGNASLVALSDEGIHKWSYELPDIFHLGQPWLALSRSGITLVDSKGHCLALDLNGKLLWEYNDQNFSYIDPVMGIDGKTYLSYFNLPGQDSSLQCITPDGTKLWSACLEDSRLQCKPEFDKRGNLILGTTDGLIALDSTGSFLWDCFASKRYSCRALLVNSETVYFRVNYQRIGALSISGEELWTAKFADSTGNEPVVLSEHVLYPDGNLVLTMRYAEAYPPGIFGDIIKKLRIGGHVSQKKLEKVVIVDSTNGKVLWQYECPNLSNDPPLVSPDGVIYISGWDGKIRALKPRY